MCNSFNNYNMRQYSLWQDLPPPRRSGLLVFLTTADKMYRIDQTLSRSYFMPYLMQLCLLMIAAPVMCAEDATTEQSDNQQPDAINVLKQLKLLTPEAAKSLTDSKVLEKAFRKMMVRFAKENAKDLGPKEVKQVTTRESLTGIIK